MPTIAENQRFFGGAYDWAQNGDEWSLMAAHCGQPYEHWKQSLVDELIAPFATPQAVALEVGCGRGRWTGALAARVASLWAVDLCETNVAFCKANVAPGAKYLVTAGDLSAVPDASVDFVWSFDVFVHIEPEDTRTYLRQFGRILKREGLAIIHHPDEPNEAGWRSKMTGKLMRAFAREEGLVVTKQIESWGRDFEFDVRLAGDLISFIRRR